MARSRPSPIPLNALCTCLRLEGVDNPFDPAPLFSDPRFLGLRRDHIRTAGDKGDFRIRDLVIGFRERFGRRPMAILLRIAAELLIDDDFDRQGASQVALARGLTALLVAESGAGNAPQVMLAGHDGPADRVEAVIGDGVMLPGPDEVPEGRILVAEDNGAGEVRTIALSPPYPSYVEVVGRFEFRPRDVGLYRRQRHLVIGLGGLADAQFVLGNGIELPPARLVIDRDRPRAALQLRHGNGYSTKPLEIARARDGSLSIIVESPALPEDPAATRPSLTIRLTAPSQIPPEGDPPPPPPEPQALRLRLTGLALPRVHGGLAAAGVTQWLLLIDADGRIEDGDLANPADRRSYLQVAASASNPGLYVARPREGNWQKLPVPAKVPLSHLLSLDVAEVPAALAETFYGMLELSSPLDYAIPPGGALIGRSAQPRLDGDAPGKIVIDLAGQTGSLQLRDGRTAAFNQAFFSRNHAFVMPMGDGIRLQMADGKIPVSRLSETGDIADTVAPGSTDHLHLQRGDRVLIGNFRFEVA